MEKKLKKLVENGTLINQISILFGATIITICLLGMHTSNDNQAFWRVVIIIGVALLEAIITIWEYDLSSGASRTLHRLYSIPLQLLWGVIATPFVIMACYNVKIGTAIIAFFLVGFIITKVVMLLIARRIHND